MVLCPFRGDRKKQANTLPGTKRHPANLTCRRTCPDVPLHSSRNPGTQSQGTEIVYHKYAMETIAFTQPMQSSTCQLITTNELEILTWRWMTTGSWFAQSTRQAWNVLTSKKPFYAASKGDVIGKHPLPPWL